MIINPITTSPFCRAGATFSYHVAMQGLLNVFSHADFDARCSPPPICVIEDPVGGQGIPVEST